jgi:hypothetical protein
MGLRAPEAQNRAMSPLLNRYEETILAFCKPCAIVFHFTRAEVPTAKCEPGPKGWAWNVNCPNCSTPLKRSSTHNKAPRKPLNQFPADPPEVS